MRFRGAGGGRIGSSPNRSVSSVMVGMGVVRALPELLSRLYVSTQNDGRTLQQQLKNPVVVVQSF